MYKVISIIVIAIAIFCMFFVYFDINRKNKISNFKNTTDVNYLFKNQYLILDKKIYNKNNEKTELLFNTSNFEFENYIIYTGNRLEFNSYKYNNNSIFLLGIITDPYNYKLDNLDIIKSLCKSTDLNMFFKKLQNKGGRFVIYYRNGKQKIFINDTSSLKRFYYLNDMPQIYSSSEKILLDYLNLKPNINEDKLKYISSDTYKKNEFKWYACTHGYHENTRKLLPNTYLDIENTKIIRIPFFIPETTDFKTVCQKISYIIHNTIRSLLYRKKKLLMPVTGGKDSRVLLSTTKVFTNDIEYYICKMENTPETDINTGIKYSEKFNFKFDIIDIRNDFNEEFLNIFKNINLYPRVLPKTKIIEYHFYNSDNKININGNVGEVIKEYFKSPDINNENEFIKLFNSQYKFVNEHLKIYYNSSINFCRKYNINITNLYYWERQQGNWGSLFPFELDVSIEEISPFNNREILLLGLGLNKTYRENGGLQLFREIINVRWNDLMYLDFN